MSGDDTRDERGQEIEKLSERTRKRIAADEITDERGRVAEEKINEAGRAKNVCGHFGICEIDEERETAHSRRDGGEPREHSRDDRVAAALGDAPVRDVHEEESQQNDDVDEHLECVVRDVGKEEKSEGLTEQHTEIERSDERIVCLPPHEKTLNRVAAACDEQHDGDSELWLVKEHEQGRGNDDETKSGNGLNECRAENSECGTCVRSDA